MPVTQVEGDPNTGGGLVETPLQTFFKASGILVSVNGTSVTPHDGHVNAKTANGSNFFHISGIPVNFVGNADTCGHTRIGDQVPWFLIQS